MERNKEDLISQISRFFPLAPVILGLCGCASPRPINYYDLQIPAAPTPAGHTYPVGVVVGRIQGSDLLEASPIVYKTRRNQMGTYAYHRWSDAPVQLLQEKLVRMLRTSGEYQSVTRSGDPSSGDLLIRGRLYDFTEVDGDSVSGLVSMEIELFNRKTAKILWTHFYTGTEPVPGKKVQVPEVAQALDRNLDRGLTEVVTGLSRYFASQQSVSEAKAK